MNKTIFILIMLHAYLQAGSLQAQQLMSTAGNYFENEQGSLSWSLGETVMVTYTIRGAGNHSGKQ